MPITSPSKGKSLLDVKSNHIFSNDTERDTYFSANPTELKEGLYICSNEILQRYENEQFVNRSSMIKGSKGDRGYSIQSITDIEGNKIRLILEDSTHFDITKTQASANNITISKTEFTNWLKDFTGNQTQELLNFIDEMNEIPNGILYFGEINTENSWKIIKENSNLNFYRYDLYNNQYNKIASFGASVESDRFILSEWQGRILGTKIDGTKRTLLKTSVDNDGVIIGNKFGRVGLVHGNKLFSMYPTGISSDFKMNECSDAEGIANAQTITKFSTYFKATIDGFYSGLKNIEVIEAPEGTTARFWATSEDKNEIIVEDCSYLNFTKGLGKEIVVGLNDLLLDEPFPIDKDTAVYFNLEFSNPVKLKGSVVDNGVIDDPKFYPMCDVIKEIANLEDLATQNWVRTNIPLSDATDSDSTTTAASSKAVNSVRKLVSTAVSGMTYLGGISCEAFSAITIGRKGNYYKLADDGIIFGTSYNAGTSVLINTDFNDRAITVNDCDFFVVEATGTGGIFITNVTAVTNGKNCSVTYKDAPNNGCVDSILTDDTSLNVTIEWDRTEEAYCGIPTVNGTSVSSYSNKTGGTYTATVTIDINTSDSIICENNGVIFSVPITKVSAPTITGFSISGVYPTTNSILQTELKENDEITCTIQTDKNIDYIEFVDFGAFKLKTYIVTAGKSFTNIVGIVANRGNSVSTVNGKIRVRSTDGSYSDYVLSSNTVVLNNLSPSMTFGAITFPAGQEAIKGTESISLAFTLSNADSNTVSAITNDLSVSNKTSTGINATRLSSGSATYNDGSSDNLSFLLRRNANGKSITYTYRVPIVTVPANLDYYFPNPYKIKSGAGQTNCTLNFNQKVKVTSVTIPSPNKGTLNTSTTSSYQNTYTLGITSADSDTKSSTANNCTINVVGMSGIQTSNINIGYILAGFTSRVVSFTYPSLSQTIGTTVLTTSNLVASGQILTTPPFDIAKTYVMPDALTTALADKYSISADGLSLLLPESIKGFGYSTDMSAQVTIQENN